MDLSFIFQDLTLLQTLTKFEETLECVLLMGFRLSFAKSTSKLNVVSWPVI